MKLPRILSIAVSALGVCASLQAAEFCATNSTELQSALTTAATNGEADTIRVAVGTYNAPPGGLWIAGTVPTRFVANNYLWDNDNADMRDFDLRGMSRVNGSTVDIGVYENHDRFFSERFEL